MGLFDSVRTRRYSGMDGTMNVYESGWETVMSGFAALALAAGVAGVGWVPVLVLGIGMALVGGLCGACWCDDAPARWRRAGDCAFWCGAGGFVLFGLLDFARPWMLVVASVLVASCPPVMRVVSRRLRRRLPVRVTARPRRLSDHGLECRWRRTAVDLRDRADSVSAILALVEERSHLLDEFERRDPEWFEAILIRSGWREPGRE